ncbi:MAG: metal-dependent hydrolase [Alphaproteobacteria bacterium CG_4_10_14_0_2_um_filter_63_37]|nr:MAG: hypothetical protein AUJ55_07735 [Proteobacteria bacterium CG1_02_64_396]PJA24439.1 MAG: metal-dependent hydrolase [Alphaproteobacteria bacterium CG_4_10_14_0_2_um_filter_63_37]
MPNAVAHRIGAGLVVGGAFIAEEIRQGKVTEKSLVGGGVAVLCDTLPDFLEPALHPNHRAVFHSFALLAAGGFGLYKLHEWEPETEGEKWLRVLGLAVGGAVAVHLLMDAKTPKGLPLF